MSKHHRAYEVTDAAPISVGRRPTYDELALAILAWRRAHPPDDLGLLDRSAWSLVALARRLEPEG